MINVSIVKFISDELNNIIAGGRIEKIQQPAKDIIILTIHNNYKKYKLLLSCLPGNCRIHLTTFDYENPSNPPMFCMLLRKHLNSSLIDSIIQENEDNIIRLNIQSGDELGIIKKYSIVIELFNRSPNIILLDGEDVIVDCIYKGKYLPGLKYRLPNKPKKTVVCDNLILDNYSSLSEYLDDYYSKDEIDRINRSKTKSLRRSINSSIKRISKKIETQNLELNNALKRDEFKHIADLITSYIWKINKGEKFFVCEDFYNNNELITIQLDPLLSPQEYASKLYKKYNKLKKAESCLNEQIKKGNDQLDYLNSILDLLDRVNSESDLDAIKFELAEIGIIKNNLELKKSKKKSNQVVLENTLSNGMKVLIGKNNIQNDLITFKLSKNKDIWFHVKDYHGSHVVLIRDSEDINADIIKECALLASQHSEAHGEKGTEINYCLIKDVHRKSNGYPGNVIFENYRTIKI